MSSLLELDTVTSGLSIAVPTGIGRYCTVWFVYTLYVSIVLRSRNMALVWASPLPCMQGMNHGRNLLGSCRGDEAISHTADGIAGPMIAEPG